MVMEDDGQHANKSHVPCQSWAGHNEWPTSVTQGPLLNCLSTAQRLSLGLSSIQRPPYDHLQVSNSSCLSTVANGQTGAYKGAPISSNQSSTSLFTTTSAMPHTPHAISCPQQSPQAPPMFIAAKRGKTTTPQSSSSVNYASYVPPLSNHDHYKSFRSPLTHQRLQEMPINLPSCGRQINQGTRTTSSHAFEGANMESAGAAGYGHSSSTPQEQPQWTDSSHRRGCIDESVADEAAHPKKEPLEEGTISVQASNDTHRSTILHQRALLLKQLAELDKQLESLPSDDNCGEQLPRTAIESSSGADSSQHDSQQRALPAKKSKSRPHMSSNCSPLASDDNQKEICDTPEDSMSAAELEEEENASVKSSGEEWIDSLFSDTDDELSYSSYPSSPEEPRRLEPPYLRKKRTMPSRSLSKEAVAIPRKKKRATDEKPSKIKLPCMGSKVQRIYDRRNYCLFCSKPMSKISRHLQSAHSDKAEVAAAFQYPKYSRERKKIWARLKNQGNFAHNKVVLRTGKGMLAVRKRPSKSGDACDFLHCLYCRGLYKKRALGRHIKHCPERNKNEEELPGRKRMASLCALETLGDIGVSEGFRGILCEMTYDDVTQVVLGDEVLLQFGEEMFSHYGANEKKHNYVRQNLRQIARLVQEAQKITPLKKLQDFFLPASFPHVVSAVNALAGYDPENKTYSVPSLAIKLGYNLQKACNIVEGNAVERGDARLAESARTFLSLYQQQWNKLISSGALSSLREFKENTAKKVPFAEDVKLLNSHLEKVHLQAEEKLRDCPTPENYGALARVILSRTIIFNRRRAGEVSAMRLEAYLARKMSNPQENIDMPVSDLERTMCGFLTRVEIRGKCGRLLPVFLKPSFVSAIELLVKVRDKIGISSKNPYLFARPTVLSAYGGAECLQRYVRECGAKDPAALSSTKIRKHYATMLQLINLDEHEADQILGPNNQVHALRQDSNMQLDETQMDSEERLQHLRGPQALSWGRHHSQPSTSHYGPGYFDYERAQQGTTGTIITGAPKSFNPGRKAPQNSGKHKWEEAEVQAVERHMMRFIQGHKVPQKSDCVQCLEAEPQALRTRSWKGVKDYVRNRITALKRQSGISTAVPSAKNYPG